MAAGEHDAFMRHLDDMVTEAGRVEAAESFLERKRIDQARRVVQMAKEMLHAEHAELNIITDEEQITVTGLAGQPGSSGRRFEDVHRDRTQSWCQNVVALADTLAIDDGKQHVLVMNTDVAQSGEVVSYLGAPIRVDGIPVGALCVFDPQFREWTESEVARLEQLAGVVSDSVPTPTDPGPDQGHVGPEPAP